MSPHILYFFDLKDFPYKEIFTGCEYPWQVLPKISEYLKQQKLGKIEATVSPSAYLINPELISIGEGSIVEPGAYIEGPCIIGKNCVIRHGAYIRGNLIAGDNCVIGHDTEVKNSVFLQSVHAAHFAYVGDCVLGNHVNLGAGVKCANLKLDKTAISVYFEDKRITTPLRKLGVILGDSSQIGCNAVTNPGTLIGQQVNCYPCINIGGFIPTKSIVKSDRIIVVSSY